VYLTDALIKVFGEFLDDNSQFLTTFFEVKYVFHNSIENATLEITSQVGKTLTFEVRYGFDELPNFDKKLAELPLEVTAITNIYAHAKTIIPQTWPAVNYNYPQIITDKYDITEDTWLTFLGRINNFTNGVFFENTFISTNFANRNIIQPTPYFLHILTAGFLDAGYILKGDVISDEKFKKLCLFADMDYFDRINEQTIRALIDWLKYAELATMLPNGNRRYYLEINLRPSKKYNIKGFTRFIQFFSQNYPSTFSKITYKSTVLFLKQGNPTSNYGTFKYDFDFNFDTNSDAIETQILKIEIESGNSWFSEVFDAIIEEVLISGTKPPDEINIKNEVNLKNVVPDITFGTFISTLKNWFNIDLTISGKDIYMNFIENEINYNDAFGLKAFEVLKPMRKFNNDISFLLKFADVDSEEYKYDMIFQNKEGFELSDLKVNKNTNTIIIDALPLPQKFANDVETAFAFDHGGNAKIYAVLYDGLNDAGLNLTKDITPVLIPSVHQQHYKNWFTFRINAITYLWKFKMYAEMLSEIKKKIYAYGRYHIIKTINKTQISEDLFEVDVESDTLK
jgi:hypothetical protein